MKELMKIILLLITLCVSSCKPDRNKAKIYVNMNKAESHKIFEKYFMCDGLLARSLPYGEILDENNKWSCMSYTHINRKFKIECFYHNDKVYSLLYMELHNSDNDYRIDNYRKSITINKYGIVAKEDESISKRNSRRKEHRLYLVKMKQIIEEKINFIERRVNKEVIREDETKKYLNRLRAQKEQLESLLGDL